MSETPPKILYLQYTNPGGLPPLQHSSRILAMSGWDILFVGIRALGIDRLQLPPNPRIEVRLMDYCSRGWRQKLHYARFCLWSIWLVLKWKPRWVYASDPLSCPAALAICRALGIEPTAGFVEVQGPTVDISVYQTEPFEDMTALYAVDQTGQRWIQALDEGAEMAPVMFTITIKEI